ncbi:hypothetical protein D3C83_08650 [compost metagenome]
MQLARKHRRSRGVIDQDRPRFQPGQRPIIAVGDRAHIIVVADAHQDEIAALRGFAGGRHRCAAVLPDPLGRFRRGAVVYGHVVAAFLPQVPCHRVTHDAQTDECDFCHALFP